MKWLDRELVIGPYLYLAMSEDSFHKALRRLRVPRENWPKWVSDKANATAHTFTNPAGGIACVVGFRPEKEGPVELACILVHEAVHVWQSWRAHIGEREPSAEFEAYAIEAISKRLMQAYADSLARGS